MCERRLCAIGGVGNSAQPTQLPCTQFAEIVQGAWKAMLVMIALDLVITGPGRWFEGPFVSPRTAAMALSAAARRLRGKSCRRAGHNFPPRCRVLRTRGLPQRSSHNDWGGDQLQAAHDKSYHVLCQQQEGLREKTIVQFVLHPPPPAMHPRRQRSAIIVHRGTGSTIRRTVICVG